jgi:hypothetical protein
MSSHARKTALVLSLCCIAAGATAADRNRVVNEGGIRDQWMLADGIKLAAPGYPAQYQDRGDNVCVAIGYAIDPKGKTGDFTVLKTWSSAGTEPEDGYFATYAAASAGAVSQWQFKPRPEVSAPQRTITVATLIFTGKQKMDGAVLRSNCQVTDLAAALQKAGNDSAKNSRLRRDMEQTLRNANAGNSMTNNPGQSTIGTIR